MFTLRTVFTYGRGSQVKETTNKFLGENYQVYYRDSHLFQSRIDGIYEDENFKAKEHYKDVFAIILSGDNEIELLYDIQYYIVTSEGKTFEKIYKPESFKELSTIDTNK